MKAFVSILDDCGFVVSLAGPFKNEDAAQEWADMMEAKDEHGDIQEPYTVLTPTDPKDLS